MQPVYNGEILKLCRGDDIVGWTIQTTVTLFIMILA